MTAEEIKQLAESQWEECNSCDENDKNMWINGFIIGYINARIDIVDNKIEVNRKKIAEILIAGNPCKDIIINDK